MNEIEAFRGGMEEHETPPTRRTKFAMTRGPLALLVAVAAAMVCGETSAVTVTRGPADLQLSLARMSMTIGAWGPSLGSKFVSFDTQLCLPPGMSMEDLQREVITDMQAGKRFGGGAFRAVQQELMDSLVAKVTPFVLIGTAPPATAVYVDADLFPSSESEPCPSQTHFRLSFVERFPEYLLAPAGLV